MSEELISLWVGRLVLLAGGLALLASLLNSLSQFAWRRVRHKARFWALFTRWHLRKKRRKDRQ